MEYPDEEDDKAVDTGKLQLLFFDPSNGYGSVQLRQMVEEVLGTQRKVTDYLAKFTDTNERRDLQEKEGYGNQKDHVTDTLNLLFDIGFDYGPNKPDARFLSAVKALGLDDGQDHGVDVSDSAGHYYLNYRNLLISSLINEMELKRVLGQSLRL